jgi:glycosyltransferase involved in cell wall biosynthesis
MKQKAWFSVVIPLYNKEKHIARALDSVMNQSYENYEVVVVNDGSTDYSVNNALAFQDSIKLINQANQGVSSARNTGIKNSKFDYIAFLDADDEWDSSFLETIAKMIELYPERSIYCTNYIKKKEGKRNPAFDIDTVEEFVSIDYFELADKGTSPVWSSAICIPKYVFDHVGTFPEYVKLYEDLYLWIKISLEYSIIFCTRPLATYHRDAEHRACNQIIPDTHDLPFADLIYEAIKSKKINEQQAVYAKRFINKYALLNAFKAVVAGKKKESRLILNMIIDPDHREYSRKIFIKSLSLLPSPVILGVWRIGVTIKACLPLRV